MSPTSSSRRRTRWALLASLCLNVAFATYIAVQWVQPANTQIGIATPLRMIERVAARLPPSDAEILWKVYRSKEPDLLPLQIDYGRAMLNTMRVVRQPDLDKEALRAAIKESRDQRVKIGDAMIDTFVETLEQISPQGRRQLVGGFLR